MTSIRDQVKEFHGAVGLPVLGEPTVPSNDRIKLRLHLIAEEFCEVLESTGVSVNDFKSSIFDAINNACFNVNMIEFVDGLADLDYVNESARLEFGVDGGPIAEEVHSANMKKIGGPIREDGKRLKPPGWKPPDILGRLQEQGFVPRNSLYDNSKISEK